MITWTALFCALFMAAPVSDNSQLHLYHFKNEMLDHVTRFQWALPKSVVSPTPENAEEEQEPENESETIVRKGELVLEGLVTRSGKVIDRFRLDFYPSNPALSRDPVWFTFERVLNPGSFTLDLSLTGEDGTILTSLTKDFKVPLQPDPEQTSQLPEDALANFPNLTHSVRIMPFDEKLKVEELRVEAAVLGENVDKVNIILGGKKVKTLKKKPYIAKIKLPRGPRIQKLVVEALDKDGFLLARDVKVINSGPYAFSVRLIEPVQGRQYEGVVKARALVEVPLDRKIERVEFFLNDRKITTLYEAPFVAPISIPEDDAKALFVRAVGYLEDSDETAEDTVLFNAPGIVEDLQVREIELWVGVVDADYRPVLGLKKEAFKVYEDRNQVDIQHFESAANLPVNLVFLTDISRSMILTIPQITKGSRYMIEEFIGRGDRASIMVFQTKPRIITPFTDNHKKLKNGLKRIIEEATTAELLGSGIHDSLAHALHYLGGIKGRRSLIVFTDGFDNRSEYKLTEVANFVRQSGVRLYVIAEDARSTPNPMERLARESGGGYYISGSRDRLFGILGLIDAELRSQYLIRYQTQDWKPNRDCAKIKIKMANKNHEAKTTEFICPN